MKPHNYASLPSTDPLEILRLRDGLYGVDLLAAAIVELDFFSWLARQPSDLPTICRELQLVPRPVDVMLTLFAALGLVEKRGNVFSVTDVAREHVVKGSPWFLGPYYASLKDRPVCQDFIRVLRTGRVANWGSFKDEKDWAKAMEDDAFAEQFTAAMDCRGVYLSAAAARAFDPHGRSKLLDIAGGSGVYACAFVAAHSQLTAAVFEKPPVDRVAARAISKRGFSDKVAVLAGDLFASELPLGFDVHLISNVLHDWDVPIVRQIIAKSFQALAPGGMIIIHDAHLNEQKTGPLPVAKYSALLMHSTEGRCYSRVEIGEYLSEAGFSGMNFQETAADRSIITASKSA